MCMDQQGTLYWTVMIKALYIKNKSNNNNMIKGRTSKKIYLL